MYTYMYIYIYPSCISSAHIAWTLKECHGAKTTLAIFISGVMSSSPNLLGLSLKP